MLIFSSFTAHLCSLSICELFPQLQYEFEIYFLWQFLSPTKHGLVEVAWRQQRGKNTGYWLSIQTHFFNSRECKEGEYWSLEHCVLLKCTLPVQLESLSPSQDERWRKLTDFFISCFWASALLWTILERNLSQKLAKSPVSKSMRRVEKKPPNVEYK